MSIERNKARAVELVDEILNGHDLAALEDFTSNPVVAGSATSLVTAFPDLRAEVMWAVAEGDMVVLFLDVAGTHRGQWLFVTEPSGQAVHTSFMLAFRFDANGHIVDQWLGSNFIEMLAQMGWGFAPNGQPAAPPPR